MDDGDGEDKGDDGDDDDAGDGDSKYEGNNGDGNCVSRPKILTSPHYDLMYILNARKDPGQF